MIVIDSNIYCRKLKILRLALFWREKMGYILGIYEKIFNFFYKVLIFSNMQHKNFYIFCLTNENKALYLQCQTTKKYNNMETNKENMQMSLRVYKDEYSENQLRYIRNNFEIFTETTNVIIISGSESRLEDLMSLTFSTDEKFKQLFNDYLTEEERVDNTKKEIRHLADEFRNSLLQIINNGIAGAEFVELRKIYFNEIKKIEDTVK